MQRKELSLVTRVVLTIFVSLPIFTDSAFASHSLEKVIYNFQGAPDGSLPQASLIADQAGNLYGTTETGGTAACTCGTVFELTPPATAGGAWAETVLYSFQGGTSDGSEPSGTLVFDAVGNLYGTTLAGGNKKGTVFELSPPATAGGAWSETVLLVFPGGRQHRSRALRGLDFGRGRQPVRYDPEWRRHQHKVQRWLWHGLRIVAARHSRWRLD